MEMSKMYLVDVEHHVNLERENVVELDVFFTIEDLKRFADANRSTKDIRWLPLRSCNSSSTELQ